VHNGRAADSVDPASAQISERTTSATQDKDASRTSTGHQRPCHLKSEAIGEIDTIEDSIDGMGAIKFTDEEDSAFFGQ
jgi:hypothetical protein